VAGVGGCRALELVALFLGLLHPCGYLHPVVPGALWIVRAQSDALHEPLGSFERVSVHLILWYAPMGAVQGKRGALEAVTLPFQLVPPVNDLAEMATMARLWPSSAAWLFFVMVMMVGSGPPFAQRHDRSGLAWLREEVSQLFSKGTTPRPLRSQSGTSRLHVSAMARVTRSSGPPLDGSPPSIMRKP
jgi:hypothetical protein